MNAEEKRLEESRGRTAHWKRWGPYLAERAWGTVREDYSADGEAWDYLPHEQARSKAYRWNEDGIAGFCDRHQEICFSLAFWNGRDPILKERLFGLTCNEGNHGEDVKEYYFYLDSTPTHSYMKFLYKYPQSEFPYARLVEESRRRGRHDPEFELLDTGVFDDERYFDIFVEYAKADVEDLLVRISVVNRGPEEATLQLLPHLWFRNTWSWDGRRERPQLRRCEALKAKGSGDSSQASASVVEVEHDYYDQRYLFCEGGPELLFTENETNTQRLYGVPNGSFVKDGIGDCVVRGERGAVNPAGRGTKAAAVYVLSVPAGGERVVRLRFTEEPQSTVDEVFGEGFERIFENRRREAEEFYAGVIPEHLSPDARGVMRQALAGLLWSKQFYHYVVKQWLEGDPAQPPPPPERKRGRNSEWKHLYSADVLSMPDKWEYPWFAAWDLAFHCV
nr:glucosidase [Acidobacteriota bacterium]